MRMIGKLSGFVSTILKFLSLKPITKKPVTKINKIKPPEFVQTLHNPSFLFILSKKSVGGNKNGNNIVKKVNDIVGADIKSIKCFN